MRLSSACILAAAQVFSSAAYAQSDANTPSRTSYEDVYVRDGNRNISIPVPLQAVRDVDPGVAIKPDTELRILCIGDSITVGIGGSQRNSYREELKEHLSGDEVIFAGTEKSGTMEDGYHAAWSGKTIQYMSDHIGPSLEQRPNVVLVHAGTNDMNPRPQTSTEGSDPKEAADRLGKLIDQIIEACPDAIVLVAVIVNSCVAAQKGNVQQFQDLTPGVVRSRLAAGKHVLAVDFAELGDDVLGGDCVHPDDAGYSMMADQWYNAMTQIPRSWIQGPVGGDPERKEVEGTAVDADGADDAEDAAWSGRAAPFWIPTALMMTWYAVTTF